MELYCVSESPGEYVDIVIARLGEIGYEAFEETESGVKAYIQQKLFDENYLAFFVDLKEQGVLLTFSHQLIPFKNWNLVWESNFEPVVISDRVYIRAEFHPQRKELPHEIIIQPKMAFGTGHHATTSLMMELMLDRDWQGKTVVDIGCGTGILSILASQLGAESIVAIDHDDIAVVNTIENATFNHCPNISAICGNADAIHGLTFDIVLANINRNIIINDLDKYVRCMKDSATILLSGFYKADCDMIISTAQAAGLMFKNAKEKDTWSCLVLEKNKIL